MTSNTGAGAPILGNLRSADGKGVVRIEDRFAAGIDDVWSALTDPRRLARWYGQIEGDLRPGGEFHGRLEYWEGTGRVEACDPPRRLLVTTKGGDEPYYEAIEATLTADSDQTILVIETRGMPLDLVGAYGSGIRSTPRISPPTSPGVSASTARRGGTSSPRLMRSWRPTSARHWRRQASHNARDRAGEWRVIRGTAPNSPQVTDPRLARRSGIDPAQRRVANH
jgi:uncharacterized protein YndB with AHSA1/START domain